MTSQKDNQILPIVFKKILCAMVSYYDGELRQFYLDDQQTLQTKKIQPSEKARPIVIISRKFYSEVAKFYPVDNKSELNKLLALEFQGHKFTKYHVWQQKEGKSAVNIWQFDECIPKAVITYPESLLLALASNIGQVVKVTTQETLFVSRQNSFVHSAYSNGIINSSNRFCQSFGAPDGVVEHKIAADSLADFLSYGFSQGGLALLPSFVNKPSGAVYIKMLKKILLPSAVIFGVYMLATSVYLLSQQHILQNKLEQQAQNLDMALLQQQKLDINIQRYLGLKEFLNGQQNSANLWLIMNELFAHASITNIRIENGRYILRGSAEKSTDVLAKLSQYTLIKDAKFDYPTRNNPGREFFVIGFTLGQGNIELKGAQNE